MEDNQRKDTVINHAGLRDYIIVLCATGIILAYVYDYSFGYRSQTIKYIVIVGILLFCIALLVLNAVYSSFTFNGKDFGYRYKRICKSSERIIELKRINEEYELKTAGNEYKTEYTCHFLEEFRSVNPAEIASTVVSASELNEAKKQNDAWQKEYDILYDQITRPAVDKEQELLDTMQRSYAFSPTVQVSWEYTSEDGDWYHNNERVYLISPPGDAHMEQEKDIKGFTEITRWLCEKAALCQYTGVYVLHNAENGKSYVGQAKNVAKRIRQHIDGKGCTELYEDFRKGDRIVVCSQSLAKSGYENLDKFEKDMIRKYRAYTEGYNKNSGNEV